MLKVAWWVEHWRVFGVAGRLVRAVQLWVHISALHAVHAVPALSCSTLAGLQTDVAPAVGRWVPAHGPARPQMSILHLQCHILDNVTEMSNWTKPWKCHSLTCMVNSHLLQDFLGYCQYHHLNATGFARAEQVILMHITSTAHLLRWWAHENILLDCECKQSWLQCFWPRVAPL